MMPNGILNSAWKLIFPFFFSFPFFTSFIRNFKIIGQMNISKIGRKNIWHRWNMHKQGQKVPKICLKSSFRIFLPSFLPNLLNVHSFLSQKSIKYFPINIRSQKNVRFPKNILSQKRLRSPQIVGPKNVSSPKTIC